MKRIIGLIDYRIGGSPSIQRSISPSIHDLKWQTLTPIPATTTETPAAAAPKLPAPAQRAVGEVISNKEAKTIIVQGERRFAHPKFKKVVTGYKKIYAHDEKGEAKVGDRCGSKKRVRSRKQTLRAGCRRRERLGRGDRAV